VKHGNLENRKSEKEKAMKKFVVLLIITLLGLSISVPVFAEDRSSTSPSVKDIVGDILWIKPLGFLRVVLEGAAYGISLPVTIPLQRKDEAREFLIEDPYSFTFERPLGEM
jgi:hypothetical protein